MVPRPSEDLFVDLVGERRSCATVSLIGCKAPGRSRVGPPSLARPDLVDQALGLERGLVEIDIERLVVEKLADRALAGRGCRRSSP